MFDRFIALGFFMVFAIVIVALTARFAPWLGVIFIAIGIWALMDYYKGMKKPPHSDR